MFQSFVEDQGSHSSRAVFAQPSQPLQGSTAHRKLDIAIVDNSETISGPPSHWSRILVPGELKSNPELDTASRTWRDLGRYVKEVFTTQDTRRFVLGFTLCGPIMRLWEFDRIGATASEPFDVNQEGERFVSAILGFLLMNKRQLGYDLSIKRGPDGKQFIDITRNGISERLILDELMKRSSCIASRATTCWKAHREGDDTTPLVVKDSWQFPERYEEGELLREALEHEVINVARYFFHQTVQIDDEDDDIATNIRRDLDLTKAKHGEPAAPSTMMAEHTNTRKESSIRSMPGRKRSSSQARINTSLPPSKRALSGSLSRDKRTSGTQNRVHRRVVIQDYGKPLYRASSLEAMLAAFDGCLEGYNSLYTKKGLLQGDISIGNLMMNEETGNASWPAFLIDLDLAVWGQREQSSGAFGRTGTRAFMPIGQLLGEKLTWSQGLESFFWVLFWMCIHYNGPDTKGLVVRNFDEWNYVSMDDLARLKLGTVSDDQLFQSTMDNNFTEFYGPLKPWVNRLRQVVFPNGGIRRKEGDKPYSQMRAILQEARDALQS